MKPRTSRLERAINTFVKQFGGMVLTIPYRPQSWAAPSSCLLTSEEMAEQCGGTIQNGWQIIAFYVAGELSLLIAQHHTVWRDSNGQLIDVQPYEESQQEKVIFEDHTYFVPDDSATWIERQIDGTDATIRLALPNKHFVVKNTPLVRLMLKAYKSIESAIFQDGTRLLETEEARP